MREARRATPAETERHTAMADEMERAAGDERRAEQAAGELLDYVEDFVRSSVTASL